MAKRAVKGATARSGKACATPVKKRAPAVRLADRWTPDRRAAFLAALARLANAAAAAREVGVPEHAPFELRKVDPAFAVAWEEAIEEGYSRLELLLLRRATYGEHADGDDAPTISTTLALGLLKSHHARAKRGTPALPIAPRGAELRDRLEARLAELHRRMQHG